MPNPRNRVDPEELRRARQGTPAGQYHSRNR